MKRLDVMFTMDCEAIDVIAAEGGPPDWDFSRRAIEGFCEILLAKNLTPTLFIVPHTAEAQAQLFRDLEKQGVELALHYHPQDDGHSDYLGAYDYDAQKEMLSIAAGRWANAIGKMPKSFRGGNYSANDNTFPVLADLGFRQTSASMPGKNFTRVKSNWAGAQMQPYFTNRANRLIPGDMDLFEIPATADWDSVLWGGLTKLELRVEMVDARAHGFTIRKNVSRLLSEGMESPYLLALTHNVFDYTDKNEFRRKVLEGIIEEIEACAEQNSLIFTGHTLSGYRAIYEAKE